MPQSHLPAVNELGGKYRVLADLGQGGTANVSLAIGRGPSGFSKLVVLKIMKRDLADEHEFSQMFLNEARLAARLNHPNIVQTNEVFEHEGRPVLVMEYLEGQSLSSVLARARGTQRFPLPMQLRVISDVLTGLHYAHELCDFDGTPLGVVHRDISPQNVFVTFDGHVKLLDFGIAKLSVSPVETAAGIIKGKIRYLSPEQITGDDVDRRADIFAIGVMLWEAATQARLWAGMRDAAILNQLMRGSTPSPKSVNAAVDDELERIVMKALARDPAQRYSTAAELQGDLDEYLGRLGKSVRQRDIGAAVADLFEDVRTQTRRHIEVQVGKIVSLSEAEYAAVRPIELARFETTQSGTSAVEQRAAPIWKRREALFAGAIALAIAGLGLGWALLQKAPPAPVAATPTTAAVASPAPASSTIHLRITAFPASAKIRLDGELAPSNPFTRDVPRDDKKHIVTIESDGHARETRELSFSQDGDIVVSLERLPATAPIEKPRAPARGLPLAPAPVIKAKPASSPNCDPPFVVDARGVKRYKPDCI